MKILKTLIFLLLPALIFGQTQNTWTKKSSFGGNKRARAVSFGIGDYGYMGMGEDTTEMTHNDLWRYDPVLDSWTQMSSLPGSTRRNAVGISLNDKGYVGLGADSSVSWNGTILSDWWEYNPTGNSWQQKTDYPGGYDIYGQTGASGVYFATSFATDTLVYICGGKMGPDLYGTDLWKYSPTTDQWTRLADFPGGDRYQLSSFGIDGKGYVGLGIDHDLYRKDWWQYDPLTDSWTEVSSLPGVERGAASTFVLGQLGFVVFGSDGGYKDELWEYNPYSDSWQIRANFPADGRKNAIAFNIGDKGYAGTGKGASGKRRSFYEYAPLLPLGLDEDVLSLNVFPNPATVEFQIQLTEHFIGKELKLFTLDGIKVRSVLVNSLVSIIDTKNLSRGTYILMINNESGDILSKKVTLL